MHTFVIDDSNLVFAFLEEMKINHYSKFEESLKKAAPSLSDDQINKIVDTESDFIDNVTESNDDLRSAIIGESIDTEEIEEASGTWGHYYYEMKYFDREKEYFEKLLGNIFDEAAMELLKELKIQ